MSLAMDSLQSIAAADRCRPPCTGDRGSRQQRACGTTPPRRLGGSMRGRQAGGAERGWQRRRASAALAHTGDSTRAAKAILVSQLTGAAGRTPCPGGAPAAQALTGQGENQSEREGTHGFSGGGLIR